ncbi:MAG: hypothetical protein AAF265_15365 [Pseudomonadota bacterium]
MLVIWRGLGWLVPVGSFGVLILTQWTIDGIYGDCFYTENEWPKYVGIGASALFVAVLGIVLNHVLREHIVDEKTGAVLEKTPSHSLFFIPIEYWSLLMVGLAYLMYA